MMFSLNDSLIPKQTSGRELRVITVGTTDESLDELQSLLLTLGIRSVTRFQTKPRKIVPATYFGKGKIDEVNDFVKNNGLETVVFDVDLAPSQLRNLEGILSTPIVDRSGVILEIFSRHARTREAKTQVELAKLEYVMPRLSHLWTHFERQKGGVGNRGMGEKQLEVDRRLLGKRIAILKKRLAQVSKQRNVQRSGRKDVLKIALVGYTNAGKSTLLNQLTHSSVRAENKLFATLDSNVRALDPHCRPPVVAIDTVGFISRIPPGLVASFRSTLEEMSEADLLLHVVDASSKAAKEQIEVTKKVLSDLKLQDKPTITVLNKIDLLKGPGPKNKAKILSPGAILVSALNPDSTERLRNKIFGHFTKDFEVWEILIPYGLSKLESMIHEYGSVEKVKFLTKGTFYRLRMATAWAGKLNLSKFKT